MAILRISLMTGLMTNSHIAEQGVLVQLHLYNPALCRRSHFPNAGDPAIADLQAA
jgi:hypothetical protein